MINLNKFASFIAFINPYYWHIATQAVLCVFYLALLFIVNIDYVLMSIIESNGETFFFFGFYQVPKPYPVEKIVKVPVEKIVKVPQIVEKLVHVPKPYPESVFFMIF